MEKICVLPEVLYGAFRSGKVQDYPNPNDVTCFGVVRRDEKIPRGFVWSNMRIGARGDLDGVVLALMYHTDGQEGIVFADIVARNFMLNRYDTHFRPH